MVKLLFTTLSIILILIFLIAFAHTLNWKFTVPIVTLSLAVVAVNFDAMD
jgi:hypothetical protein